MGTNYVHVCTTKVLIGLSVILYSLRSVCWLVGSEPVESGVVQKKSGNTGDVPAAWMEPVASIDHMTII